MGILHATFAEIVHLFVDDGALALALAVWCAAIGVAATLAPSLSLAWGTALFLGCATILLTNVVRSARLHAAATRPQ
ncbi:hypothetical protein QMO56_19400 [Roseomonas sp. E05]|uniref:hypothetical protein n=1 Tax=Roseomonas sp. E05 TaxID=3046310 RepID=UPI0024BA28AD|nr:hypothetical protein [Roseomonas sp. E05]MDJ0390282.1 hypothetical protein [Roseomonas sp. E05]